MTFVLPLFVKTAVSELLLPTLTLPKLKLDVLRPNNFVAASPVPLSAIARGEFGALLLSVIEPLTAPAASVRTPH